MPDTEITPIPLAVSLVAGPSLERFRQCLQALRPAFEGFEPEMYVTDNLANYDVEREITPLFPNAEVLKNTKVMSLGACHNQALRKAKAGLFFALTDEVGLFPRALEQLYVTLERHPQAAMAGPTFYPGSWDAKPVSSGWELNDWLPTTIRIPLYYLSQELGGRLFFEPRVTDSTLKEIELAYVNGSCFLAKREALLRSGGFDEGYALYLEDCDLGHRLRHQGYKLYQAEGAKCLLQENISRGAQAWKDFFQDLERYNRKNSSFLVSSISRFFQGFLDLVLRLKGELDAAVPLAGREFNKILVYKTGEPQDLLLAAPALAALRERFPDAEIILLGNAPSVHVLRSHPALNEVRELPGSFGMHPLLFLWQVNDSRTKSFLKELSLERWDLFIEFQELFSWLDIVKPWMVARFSRAGSRVGLDTDGKGIFLTHRVPDSRERLLHATRRYAEAVRVVGASVADFKTSLTVSDTDQGWADQWLREMEVSPGDLLIAVHTAGEPPYLKRTSWPRHYFVKLLDQLKERYPLKFLLTSSSDIREINWVNSIRDQIMPLPLMTGPEITSGQLTAVLKRTRLLIANDSGILHQALAVGCPVVGIFGPGDYQLYGSYGDERDLTALYRPIDCRPCVNFACEDTVCLKSVTPEAVFEVVSKKIESLQRNSVEGAGVRVQQNSFLL